MPRIIVRHFWPPKCQREHWTSPFAGRQQTWLRRLSQLIAVVVTALCLGTPATAGPPVSLPTLAGGERSFGSANESPASARSGALVNEWRFRKEWGALPISYGSALRFARCVARLDATAAARMLQTHVAAPSTRANLVRLAAQNRGCVPENGAIPPILMRAAFAELIVADPIGAVTPTSYAIGLPPVVDGFDLSALASCQHRYAPDMAARLFKTRPGSADERGAAEALFAATPGCVSGGLGGISPTVARLAVVEASLAATKL